MATADDDPRENIAAYADLVAAIVPVEERLATERGIAVGG